MSNENNLNVGTMPTVATSGGAVPFFNDAVAGAVVNVKATGKGQLYALDLVNTTAAAAYLQVFNAPLASVVLGTTPPAMTVRLLASVGKTIHIPAGVDLEGTGISVAGTTTATGAVGAAISTLALYK